MIDTAGLRVMQAIADEQARCSVAHKLGFSQPAISQMVRRLEAARARCSSSASAARSV